MSPDSENADTKQVYLVIIVCAFLVILSYFTILKRLLCRISFASSSRNLVQREVIDPVDGSLQLQSYGLEYSAIHSLPIYEFKKNEGEEQKPINAECAICLGEFEEGEWLKHIPNCTHAFHVSCIDTWFESHSSCPLCRSHVHHDLSASLECSVSTYPLLETLRREDFSQERAQHFQLIHSEILRNLTIRQEQSSPD